MKEIEKELEGFIASGKATTKVNSGRFQTTHIDPLKIAKHFAQWGAAHLTNKASKIASEDLEQAAEQAEQREGNLINGRFKAGFKSGAQWDREQMMKDAIETTIDGKVVKLIVIDE